MLRSMGRRRWPCSRDPTGASHTSFILPANYPIGHVVLSGLCYSAFDSICNDSFEHIRLDCWSRLWSVVKHGLVSKVLVNMRLGFWWQRSATILESRCWNVALRSSARTNRLRETRVGSLWRIFAAYCLSVRRSIGGYSRWRIMSTSSIGKRLTVVVGNRTRSAVTIKAVVRIVRRAIEVHVCSSSGVSGTSAT